jgi:hypothetical protein
MMSIRTIQNNQSLVNNGNKPVAEQVLPMAPEYIYAGYTEGLTKRVRILL